MDLKSIYNLTAEDWHKEHQNDNWGIVGTNKFVNFLTPGALILDAGCGGGTISKYLISKGFKVVGIDFSEKMVDIAKREVPSGSFLVMDLANVGKLDQVFDAIFLRAVLLHIPKVKVGETIKGLLKKLKSHGHLYLAVKEKKPDGPEEEVKKDDGRFFSYFTMEEIKNYLTKEGLEIVFESITPSGKVNWIQIIAQGGVGSV
jgi:2-polyprenyl-3-methyl-5-hydroxy-6-metoxy-1,4-benzoquinol methylase